MSSVDRAGKEAGLLQMGVRDAETLVLVGMDCHNSATSRSDLRNWPSSQRVSQRRAHSPAIPCMSLTAAFLCIGRPDASEWWSAKSGGRITSASSSE
jgi:hypothetical protein